MPTTMAALQASCQPMTAPVSPQAVSSAALPHPIGVMVCSSQRSGRSSTATASISRDRAGLAARAALADADDAAGAGDADAPGDFGEAAAEAADAPVLPADPGRAWRAEVCDVV
ncbi:hypothetical protein FK256_07215 [Actinomyces johnsonii]|uniref:Uncharacterized protein n=2 Tax=Actinomyces johnsonii TaxID=544581 RepID=A0A508A2V1_9ACTO|nr:hypothetical protein F4W10_11425 [Actinomyces johnsonii]TQD43073.1 hypothetical protein FK256_07215 [Actinomyces johnsonii]